MISYISVYTPDVKKGLELYEKCLEVNPWKPPLYGKNLEILIPFPDWNNYVNSLFPTLEELRELEIKEYLWDTDEKLDILPRQYVEDMYIAEKNKFSDKALFSYLGQMLVSINKKLYFLSLTGEPFIIKTPLYDSSLKLKSMTPDQFFGYVGKSKKEEVIEKVRRRFVNYNPRRFINYCFIRG